MLTRVQPDLPTPSEAKDNHYLLYSDHIPIVTQVPITSAEGSEKVSIFSWNVMEGDSFNGFSTFPQTRYGETETQSQARFDRIAAAIATFTAAQSPTFIALSEIRGNAEGEDTPDLLNKIMKQLPRNYLVARHADGSTVLDDKGCVIIYNSLQVALVEQDNHSIDTILQGCTATFRYTISGKKIKLGSVHAEFSVNPVKHENAVREFLEAEDDDTCRVVIGDFNCTVAPLSAGRENITTSAAPTAFRYDHPLAESDPLLQGAYAIDGAFYSSAGSRACKQATIKYISPEDGTAHDTAGISFTHQISSVVQLEEFTTFRPQMTVDDSFSINKLPGQDYTIFEYEKYLQTKFQDETILVRPSVTQDNNKGVSVILNRQFRTQLREFNNERFKFHGYNGTFYVTIAAENFAELTNAIDNLTSKNKLENDAEELQSLATLREFSTKVNQLRRDYLVPNEVKNEFSMLASTLTSEFTANNHETLQTVAQHFTTEIDELIGMQAQSGATETTPALNNQAYFNHVKQSAKALDRELYGKKPMSKKLRFAIGGVIGTLAGLAVGAVAGAVIGGLAGAAATFYLGGFGVIPGVVAGTAAGAGIGAGIGVGAGVLIGAPLSGVAGAGALSSCGFLSGIRSNKRFKANHEGAKENLGENTAASINRLTKIGSSKA